jgi:hypothetical protein
MEAGRSCATHPIESIGSARSVADGLYLFRKKMKTLLSMRLWGERAMSDITQRLRLHPDNKMKHAMQQDCLLAADCIDRLRAELAAAKVDAERWRWWRKNKIRPIYRPGHPRIEHYIDGQTIAWSKSDQDYADAIDSAIDSAMGAKHE